MRIWIVVLLVTPLRSNARADVWRLPVPGEVLSRVVAESSLTRHRVMHPVSIAPDVVLGVRENLAVALHHSRMFDGRLGAGNGVCVVGWRETLGATPADCGAGYSGGGFSWLYAPSPFVTARAGVSVANVSPMKLAMATGCIVRFEHGRWRFVVAPTLVTGLTNREAGNRDRVQAPMYLGATLGRGELHVRSGFDTTIETASDTFTIPLGAGSSFAIDRAWRVGAELTLDKALGMLNAMSWRSGSLYVEFRHGGDA